MTYSYSKNTPPYILVIAGLTFLVALFPIINLVILGWNNLNIGITSKLTPSELGQFGDFFGGHTAAFTGSASLILILFFSYHQSKQQNQYFIEQKILTIKNADRQLFLDGINLITQWDIKSPGCDQSMRLLDYYARLAIQSEDRELKLLLNTVITAKIRANLEGANGSFRATNYPFACEVVVAIATLREADVRALKAKGMVGSSGNLSTP